MKREWKWPELEVLNGKETSAASNHPSTLDATYSAGISHTSHIFDS